MTTINIHKDKLLPAAFAYQQRKLVSIGDIQRKMIDEDLSSLYGKLFHKNSHVAAEYLRKNNIVWIALELQMAGYNKEYVKLQTACRVAEDGIVSLDIDVVQRIFGEE